MATPGKINEINKLQTKFQTQVEKLKVTQKNYQKLIAQNNQLDTQLNENTMVKEELDLVKNEDSLVYKLTGPVLVKQSLVEAKENVERRIKFIESELSKNKALLEKAKEDLAVERERVTDLDDRLQHLIARANSNIR